MNWSFADIWNDAVMRENRQLAERNYVYASEIGTPFIDRYYKMLATPFTNPPNMRSLRKFEAGNIWEWIISYVLTRCGILKSQQKHIIVNLDGLLPVHGRLDFIAGGVPSLSAASKTITELGLPQSLEQATYQLIEKLVYRHGTLDECIIEFKSCSTFVMDAMEKNQVPLSHHELQAYSYILGTSYDNAKLVYLCKDDCRMMEFDISRDNKEVEKRYIQDLTEMTNYFKTEVEPNPSPKILFDQITGKFKKNIFVEYSPYLNMIYGYETPREYSSEATSTCSRFNRVVSRYKSGAKITQANEEVREEIISLGFDFDGILLKFNPTVESEDQD